MPPQGPRGIGSPGTKNSPWGPFWQLSPERRASLPCSTAWGGGTRGSQLTIEQHEVGETWFFHQVEKTHQLLLTAALPRCPSTLMPTPYFGGAGSSQRWSWQRGLTHPSPSIPVPHPPGSLLLTAGGTLRGSHLSHQPPATPCALTLTLLLSPQSPSSGHRVLSWLQDRCRMALHPAPHALELPLPKQHGPLPRFPRWGKALPCSPSLPSASSR